MSRKTPVPSRSTAGRALASLTKIIGFYVYAVIVVWLLWNYQTFHTAQAPLLAYAANHEQELKSELFGQLFDQSRSCESMSEEGRLLCEANVQEQLSLLINEEQLADPYWPNDLFFVRRQEGQYEQLRWSGRFENISAKVGARRIAARTRFLPNFMTGDCNFFNSLATTQDACELYVPVTLVNGAQGYLVRQVAWTGELSFPLAFVLPVYLLFLTILTTIGMIWGSESREVVVRLWMHSGLVLIPALLFYSTIQRRIHFRTSRPLI